MFFTRTHGRGCGVLLIVVVFAVMTFAQSPVTRSALPKNVVFEVTSIKESKSAGSGIPQWSGDRLTIIGTTLRGLILRAYPGYGTSRLVGGPEWVTSTRFDVLAKVSDPDVVKTEAQRVQALQALLGERFGLVMSFERHDFPAYSLVRARPDGGLGPGLQRSYVPCGDPSRLRPRLRIGEPISVPGPGQRPACGMAGRDGLLVAGNVTIEVVPNFLLGRADRLVIDRTGLTENFDVVLTYSPMVGFSPDASASRLTLEGPSIFAALEEQLGLKLEPTRTPLEVLVITLVERPVPD